MNGSIQTNISKRAKGYKGSIINNNPMTKENTISEGIVGVGMFCKFGTTGVVPLTAITDKLAGVVLKADAFDGDVIPIGQSVALLKRGETVVYCETACVKGDAVFVRCVVNTGKNIGDVRNDADTAKAVAHPTAIFSETLSSAGLVKIEIK